MVQGADRRGATGDGPEWYSLKDVAQVLGLTRQGVHRRVRKGQLEAEQVDGVWRVSDAAVAAAVEAKRREAVSLGSVRVLPVGAPTGDEGHQVAARLEALEAMVAELRDEHRRAQTQRDQEVAALEETCARLRAALHQMVDLMGSAQATAR